MSLKGKVALVTGSGRGIGKIIANDLAESGATVIINDIADAAENTSAELRDKGFQSTFIKANIASRPEVVQMMEKITRDFGSIDILVNNAGITSQDRFADISLDRWNLILNVNLNGTVYCTHAVLPKMTERNSGVIINMSSILATRVQYSVAYGVTKAAIERFTTGLARELRRTNISVSCMKPFFVKTEVVTGFLEGKMDMTDWEETEMWGKYCTRIAAAEPQITAGKIFDQALLKETFGPWQ